MQVAFVVSRLSIFVFMFAMRLVMLLTVVSFGLVGLINIEQAQGQAHAKEADPFAVQEILTSHASN